MHKAERRGVKSIVAKLACCLIGIILAGTLISPKVFADSGYNWTRGSSPSSQTIVSVATSANGQYVLVLDLDFFLLQSTTYLSTDYGATWTTLSSVGPAGDQIDTAVSSSGQYMAVTTNNHGLFTSSNFGTTWSNVAEPGSSDWSLAMSSDGQKLAVSALGGDIYTSSNFGSSWTDSTASLGSKPWEAVASSSNGQYLAGVISSGGIYTSNDFGATWTNQATAGSRSWTSITSSGNGKYLAASVNNGGIYTSNDFGATWTAHNLAGGVTWLNMSSSLSGQYLAVGSNTTDVYTSKDYGATWTAQSISGNTSAYATALSAEGDYLYVGDDSYVDIGNDPSYASGNQAVTVNTANGGAIAMTTPTDTAITCSNAVTSASLPTQDTGYSYPIGLLNLCFDTVTSNNQVTITFVTNLTPSQVVARDYNTKTQTYSTVSGAVITETTYGGQHALQLTYALTDNGSLDSNSLAVSITDPVGLAIPTSPQVQAPATGYGKPSRISAAQVVGIPSMGVMVCAVLLLARLYRRSSPGEM